MLTTLNPFGVIAAGRGSELAPAVALQCQSPGDDTAPPDRPRTAASCRAGGVPRRYLLDARLGHEWLHPCPGLAGLRSPRHARGGRRVLLGIRRPPGAAAPSRLRIAGRLRRLDGDLRGVVSRSFACAGRRPARAVLRGRIADASRHAPLGGRPPGGERRRRPGNRRARRVDCGLAARARRSRGPVPRRPPGLPRHVLERPGGDGGDRVLARDRARRPSLASARAPRARARRQHRHDLPPARHTEQGRRGRPCRLRGRRLRRLPITAAAARADRDRRSSRRIRGSAAHGAVASRGPGVRRRGAARRHDHAPPRGDRHGGRPRVRLRRPARPDLGAHAGPDRQDRPRPHLRRSARSRRRLLRVRRSSGQGSAGPLGRVPGHRKRRIRLEPLRLARVEPLRLLARRLGRVRAASGRGDRCVRLG